MDNLLITGLLMSGGIGILYQLKGIPAILWRKLKQKVVYTVKIYDSDLLFYVLENWLYKNHNEKYRDTEAGYSILEDFEQPSKVRKVHYKQGSNIFSLKYLNKRLYFAKSKDKIDHASERRNLFSNYFTIWGWKSKETIETLLNFLTQEYNKSLEDNRITFYIWGWDSWRNFKKKYVKPLDEIILKDKTKRFIQNDIENFLEKKEWYEKVNITYKRTYLFCGPPGTGKSTLAFALAAKTGRDICIMNLNTFASDRDLVNSFTGLPNDCLLLIEDIDSSFVKRENTKDSKISFSCFLNCLDGALAKEGIITVMTTNYVEKLDTALLREGRTDVKMEISNPTEIEVSKYLSLFYEEEIQVSGNFNISMAAVQELCLRNKHSIEAIRALQDTLGTEKVKITSNELVA